ncbi:MAG: hypothetical protein SNJ84_05265 [Verrucomicrobiia bacterium]
MIYSLSLPLTSLLLGLLLTILGAVLLTQPQPAARFLKALPRSTLWGNILFLAGALWFFILMATIDLMEYTAQRGLFLSIIAIGTVLVLIFAREFLAVRGLGILFLLAAQILLDSAFLRDDPARLLMTLTAYIAIVLACFWVGAPYLLRDQIAWAIASPTRLRTLAWSVTTFGLVFIMLGIFLH